MMLYCRKRVSRAFVLSVLFCVLLFPQSHAQDKAIEGIDMGLDNAVKYTVSEYDALWNPAVSASYSNGFAGYFQTDLFPQLNMPLKGYGIVQKEGKNSYQFFYDKFDASGAGLSWVERKYRVGYGTQLNGNLFAGVNYKWMKTDAAWSDGSAQGRGKGWDAGLLYKATHSAQIEFLYLNFDTTMNWSTGTKEHLPSTKIIQCTFFKPFKQDMLRLSLQSVLRDNKTLKDRQDMELGISYRFKKTGAVRVIFPDAGLYLLYGVTLRVGDLFVHYDVRDDKDKGLSWDNDRKYLSIIAGF